MAVITVDVIEQRLARLNTDRANLRDAIIRYNGAIEQAEWTLKVLNGTLNADGSPAGQKGESDGKED